MTSEWYIKNGIEIESFKKGHESFFFFDRMSPSGSSWLPGVKVKQVLPQAHAVIEPGKRYSMNNLHQSIGHTGQFDQQVIIWDLKSQESRTHVNIVHEPKLDKQTYQNIPRRRS